MTELYPLLLSQFKLQNTVREQRESEILREQLMQGGVNAVRKNKSSKQFSDSAVCHVGRGLDIQQVAVTLTGRADDSASQGVRWCSAGQ